MALDFFFMSESKLSGSASAERERERESERARESKREQERERETERERERLINGITNERTNIGKDERTNGKTKTIHPSA